MGRLHGISANGVGSFKEIDMYDFSELRPNGKETAIAILVCVALLVVIFCAGYMLGLRNAGTANSDGGNSGTEQVGQHIQSAVAGQREITERIDGLQGGAAQVAGNLEKGAAGVDAAAVANSNAEGLVRESGELIAEGQRILQTIRRRAEKNSVAH